MPELPEVAALVADLRPRIEGRAIVRAHLTAFSALKTFDPPLDSFTGIVVDDLSRHGKFLDVEASGLHLVIHLSRAGWIRWHETAPASPPRPGGKNPLALRIVLEDDSGFDITEAGTQKRLAVYAVRDPGEVPGIARLGPDPLDDAFTREVFAAILDDAGRAQIKGVLRNQSTIAGIGNAYSDEILHAARMSPFKPASTIEGDAMDRLYDAIGGTLRDAIARAEGVAAAALKKEKKSALRVHGRAGESCPVCGDTVAEVSFADSSLQYCPACQTGGKKLADRRMSKLLK